MSYEKEFRPEEGEPRKQTGEQWLSELGKFTPEQFAAELGNHLSPDRLREHGEGRVRSDTATDEALHIALCSSCFPQMQRYERMHVDLLRSKSVKPLDISNAFLETMTESSPIELIRMRSLLVVLSKQQGALTLLITADNLSELTELRVEDTGKHSLVPYQKRTLDRVLQAQLGDASSFQNRQILLSISFQKQDLLREFRFVSL